ncbi:MAG TPA: phytoene desaturase family protein [Pseudomonadota bacterium]|nr:phytoene desaturase family protein [Pseudomonadota bacterium]
MPAAPARAGGSAIIVGAGIGGLATAVRLLAAGRAVTVLERAAAPGGKMRQLTVGGQVFDGGPSVLTMPGVLDELCTAAGVRRADLIALEPLAPLCRHFFADGTVLDLFADEPVAPGSPPEAAWARSTAELSRVLGATAAAQFSSFRHHAARIYGAVEQPFMRRPVPSNPLALPFTHTLGDLLRMRHLDARRSLWQALGSQFDDERLRVLFARYATYSGADPFLAPATLSVIAHVEMALGVYAVVGGMYQVAAALAQLVARLGGSLRCGAEVERIELDARESRAVAVHVGGERLLADDIIVNCDVGQLYARLCAGTRLAARRGPRFAALPPSLSAYLDLIVAADAAALPLCHHNVFFSADYQREFQELRDGPPRDPTVYLCNPDWRQAAQRWFFLTNAPAQPLPGAADAPVSAAWTAEQQAACHARVGAQLARHGIDLSRHARAAQSVTPRDFAERFPCSRGALYGAAASSRLAAFKRPPNRVPGVPNLYCVGGSTHPGAGVPMVMLSAQLVAEMILGR